MIVRTTSHRSREKLERLLGYEPQGYFSFNKRGDWREIPDWQAEDALKIKGISRSKLPEGAMRYLDWSK